MTAALEDDHHRERPSEEDIGKEVLRIQERDGVCTAEAFVDEARDEASPLHSLFDWDDQAEAELWRQHKARSIIGRVRVTMNGSRTPAHVSVTITTGGTSRRGYVPLEVAMADDDLRAQVFRDARAGLKGWKNRLKAFSEAQEAVAALDAAIEFLTPPDEDSE